MEYIFSIEAMANGNHEYKDIWDVPVTELLPCQRDIGNIYGMFAGAVVKESTIFGHCPRDISAPCFIFIWRGGSISCQVTGGRRYSSDLSQGGLEGPCVFNFNQRATKAQKRQRS